LPVVDAKLTGASADHPIIKIAAQRTLIGSVRVYDAAAGSYIPVPGAVIAIAALNRKATSNAAGKFTISQLPAGDFVVTITASASSCTQTVALPVRPATLHDDFRISSLTGEITSALTSSSY
jgi:hypothetical protein